MQTERKNEKKGERKERTKGRRKEGEREDAERLEGFITFTDTRGHGEGEMLVSCSTKIWMKDILWMGWKRRVVNLRIDGVPGLSHNAHWWHTPCNAAIRWPLYL